MAIAQGVYLDVPEETYHADLIFGSKAPVTLSNSTAKVLLSASPAHAREAHPRLRTMAATDDDKESFDLGKTVHALLRGDISDVVEVDAKDWRTKAAQAARDEARAAGRMPILTKHWLRVQEMHKAVTAQLAMQRALPGFYMGGHHEVTLVWQEANGVWCKCRLDWVDRLEGPAILIGDAKSTVQSARPDQFDRAIANMDYDMQAAFYRRGAQKVFGTKDVRFVFMAAETSPPYAISFVEMGHQGQTYADEKVAHAIDLWGKCLAANEFPSYPTRVHQYEPTTWVMERWEDRLRADRENRGLLATAYDFQKPLGRK